MSQSGVIIRRNANTMVPNAYWELALKENPTAWGAAIVTDDGLMVNCGEEPTLELFQDTMKTFMDKDITFYLCNSEAGINMDDVSPFSLIEDADGNPQIVGFIDGNFPGHMKKESSHPGEFFFFNEHLKPKFAALAEFADNDLDKVMEGIAKPVFKKEMLLGAVSRGYVTIVAGNGKTLSFAQGDTSAEYPWGWVSNNYGYAMAPKQETTEEPKKRSMFPSRSTVREKAGSATAAVQAIVDKPVETAGAQSVIKNYTKRKLKVPQHLNRKDKKIWCQKRVGYAPHGFDQKDFQMEVWIDPENDQVMLMTDIKQIGLDAAALPKLDNIRDSKDTETTHIEPAISGEIMPIMSPNTREYVNKLRESTQVKQIIAENGKALQDPRVVKGLEEKHATFAAQLGATSIDEFLYYTPEMYFQLCKDKPDAGMCLLHNFRNIILSQKASKVTTAEKQELAAQELKPEVKRSMFPSKKVA